MHTIRSYGQLLIEKIAKMEADNKQPQGSLVNNETARLVNYSFPD
jgi:hypothetical protein